MSAKKPTKVESLYILVEWIGENRFSVLRRSKLLVPMENEIEINKKYYAEWKSVPLEVELLFFGSREECETNCSDITDSKNKPKKLKQNQESKNIKARRIKNLSILDDSTQESTDLQKAHSSSSYQGKSSRSIPSVTVESQALDQGLDDRNKLIESLKKTIEEKDSLIEALRDELEAYKSIQGYLLSFYFKIRSKFNFRFILKINLLFQVL